MNNTHWFHARLLAMLVLLIQPAFVSLDILIIGSTHSYSDGGETGVVDEKPFNSSGIATQLQSILAKTKINSMTLCSTQLQPLGISQQIQS